MLVRALAILCVLFVLAGMARWLLLRRRK